jgi:hypothetical protein
MGRGGEDNFVYNEAIRRKSKASPEQPLHFQQSDLDLIDKFYDEGFEGMIVLAERAAAAERLPEGLGGLSEKDWRARRAAVIFRSFTQLYSAERNLTPHFE